MRNTNLKRDDSTDMSLNNIVNSLEESFDRESFENQMQHFDQKLYEIYAQNHYEPNLLLSEINLNTNKKTMTLGIPKQNSLTDSMLRTALGCEQKLAKSYLQILDQTQVLETQAKKKRIEQAKNKFAKANSHKDFTANSKPFISNIRFTQSRPVVDNEHQAYLKTQLIYLEQPKGTAINTKQYFDKHSDIIAKKINELGGMEDTISRMEDSLAKNQIKNFKKKQILSMGKERQQMFSPSKNYNKKDERLLQESWIDRSRQMRQTFKHKFQIQ